ncbi:MAG: hypothetical protein NZ578_17480 [Candidatus Binatia bacterium]|nr:hypothetical protein [Candidatus Binatia bacterium]
MAIASLLVAPVPGPCSSANATVSSLTVSPPPLYIFGIAFFLSLMPAVARASTPDPFSALPGVTLVDGGSVPVLQGQPLPAIHVYAFRGESAAPIPFQIDERDRRDRWVLEQGPRPNPDEAPGVFDANDAIVLMNRDLGRRGDFAHLPRALTHWAEIRVGPASSPLGFAYVGVLASSPPATPDSSPYVRYDPARDRVYAERYAVAFDAPLPTHVALVGELGDFGTNLVAGVRARGEVRFLGGLFTVRRTDQDIRSLLYGYREGPVRVIRRAQYWIPLPVGLHTTGRVDFIFYRDFVEGTALVKITVPPHLVLADGELLTYFDFLDLRGACLLIDGTGPSEPVDGHRAKQAFTGRPARWAALLLPDGRTVLLLVRLEGALQKLEQRLYLHESDPVFGFQFSHLHRLETGTHRLSVFALALTAVSVEEIRRTAAFFLSPPPVHVSTVQEETGSLHARESQTGRAPARRDL